MPLPKETYGNYNRKEISRKAQKERKNSSDVKESFDLEHFVKVFNGQKKTSPVAERNGTGICAAKRQAQTDFPYGREWKLNAAILASGKISAVGVSKD